MSHELSSPLKHNGHPKPSSPHRRRFNDGTNNTRTAASAQPVGVDLSLVSATSFLETLTVGDVALSRAESRVVRFE
jgi:hypothetical protein